jgi:VanZ family protein
MPIKRALANTMAKIFESTERGWGRWLVAAVTVSFVANLFYLGAKPFAVGLFPSPWDKLAHLLTFGFIASLLWLGWLRQRPLWVVILVTLIGVADEMHQQFLPGRSADPYDLLTDMAAALLAVTLLHAIGRALARIRVD